jgi:hypothetical protein
VSLNKGYCERCTDSRCSLYPHAPAQQHPGYVVAPTTGEHSFLEVDARCKWSPEVAEMVKVLTRRRTPSDAPRENGRCRRSPTTLAANRQASFAVGASPSFCSMCISPAPPKTLGHARHVEGGFADDPGRHDGQGDVASDPVGDGIVRDYKALVCFSALRRLFRR